MIGFIIASAAFTVLILLLVTALLLTWYRHRVKAGKKNRDDENDRSPSIGFLHPHALSGGGGERVLWSAIASVRDKYPNCRIILYSAFPESKGERSIQSEAVTRAERHFGVQLQDVGANFDMVNISDVAHLVDPKRYPRMTMILQALGMIWLGAAAYLRRPTDILIDTANLTFGLLFPKLLGGATTISYVHYPTISTDMLSIVKNREVDVHNDGQTARSTWKTSAKLVYYWLFASLYRVVGNAAVDVPLANSTWTAEHLVTIWKKRDVADIPIVYPPCPVGPSDHHASEEDDKDADAIVSVGQFRPEKRHQDQLRIMGRVVRERGHTAAKLIMVGGVRDNAADRARVAFLRREIEHAGLAQHVELRVNADRAELQQLVARASVGLHTMRYEHFGISVVELMTAGVLVVAHRSGGVAADIVRHGQSGFLATSEDDFVNAISTALSMPPSSRKRMRTAARRGCTQFSEANFRASFAAHTARCVALATGQRPLGR